MRYAPEDVANAISGIRGKLAWPSNDALQQEFDAGLHPNFLAYEKIRPSGSSLPMLEKYLIGATSFLHQPSNYYDVFGACRCVKLLQALNSALNVLLKSSVSGLENRLRRLKNETRHDAFDAAILEFVVAGHHANRDEVAYLEFVQESPGKKTADLLVVTKQIHSLVECKKIDRTQDYTLTIRIAAAGLLNEVLNQLRAENISAVIDVVFHHDPRDIKSSAFVGRCLQAARGEISIANSEFTVTGTHLPRYHSDDFTLYPSAKFFWDRYRYRTRSDWIGLVHKIAPKLARRIDLPVKLRGGRSSWLADVEWDAAAKWRITSEEILAKYRRFAFSNIFKGIEQIGGGGPNSSVHMWLETDYYIAGRKDALGDLFKRLVAKSSEFGWIIINETLLDVSPRGFFDMIEHAHIIRGPKGRTSDAPVTLLFTSKTSPTIAEFGVGHRLPDIDESM